MNSPIIFKNVLYFDNIAYVELTDREVDNIRPGYFISIYGIVYNATCNKFRKPTKGINSRYYSLEFKRKDNSRVSMLVHKVIMRTFYYYDTDIDNLEIGHVDGNRLNNNISNLEYVTHDINVQRAYNLGLMPSGENNKFSVLNEKEVREICNILQTENRYKGQFEDIAIKYNVSQVAILEIAYGYNWTRISSEYNIDYNNKLNNRFTEEQVHEICKLLQQYGYYSINVVYEIADILNLIYTDSLRQRIRKLYARDPGYFKRITDLYKW